VIEFAAAFALPVIVIAAGHSDWVLPSIAITIGPLLLWLDRRVHIPRYRPVGWALTVGPVILVATISGTALVATHGHRRRGAVARYRRRRLPGPRRSSAGIRTRQGECGRRACGRGGTAVSEDPLHVVFGAGQVGCALTARLSGLGLAVRAVSRHRPPALPGGVDWRGGRRDRPRRRHRRGTRRIGRLPMPERAVHGLAGAVPATAARGAERS
jgi:hypothetical protein